MLRLRVRLGRRIPCHVPPASSIDVEDRPFEDELYVATTSLGNKLSTMPAEGRPDVFVAIVDYAENGKVFNNYKLRSVPMLVYFAPTLKAVHSSSKLPEGATFVSENTDAEGIASFIAGQTGVRFEVQRPIGPRLLTLTLVLAVLGATVYYGFESAIWLWAIVSGQTWLWLVACLGVYYISISGVLYDIIRGVPSVGVSSRGTPQIIHPQSGQQYGMEGLIIGFLNVSAGLALVFLARFVPRLSSNSQLVAGLIGAMVFLATFSMVLNIYRFKNPWYQIFNLNF